MGKFGGGCKAELRWSDDRIAQLEVLWTTGLSAAEIGEELGCFTAYRDGGRCAVLGKARRLNLPSRIPGYGDRVANGCRRPALGRAPRRLPSPAPRSGEVIPFIFKVPTIRPGTSKTAHAYRSQIKSAQMSKSELRSFLSQAVVNTAALQVAEAS